MRLATVSHAGRPRIVAAIDAQHLVDITELLADDPAHPPIHSLKQLIAGGEGALDRLRTALGRCTSDSARQLSGADIQWLPPIPDPGKICAVAMNNSASNARKISAPAHPAFFLKPASCLVGHGGTVRVRAYYGSVHPEPELALVIGRTARDVAAVDALSHVFGYTIFNDITGNGMRSEDRFHYWAIYADEDNPGQTRRVEQHLSYAARYKGTDTFGVLGPWLVTADEISNPDDLDVYCAVGSEAIANDSTAYYNFKVAEVISFLSHFMTLHPGDIISLGTAFKAGSNRKSIHQANLQHIDEPVITRIEGLGEQQFAVAVDAVALGEWRLP